MFSIRNFNYRSTKLFLSVLKIVVMLYSISTYAQMVPDYGENLIQTLNNNQLAFRSSNGSSEASIDPDEYIIGPGENFFISISGIEEINLNLLVNMENYLFIPKVGAVDLKGLSLKQAKQKIKSMLEGTYRNVELFISLTSFKKIKVSVVGDIPKPVVAIVPSNTRIFDLLLDTVDFNKTSSLRNIQIKKNNGEVRVVDFLAFIRYADKQNNILLNDGDIICINKADQVVSISGAVKFPGTYDLVDGETVNDLIKIAGSFLYNARVDSIEIVRYDKNGKTQQSYYYSHQTLIESNVILKLKDHVIVRVIPDYYIDNFVLIEGRVKYPGVYKIKEDETKLSEIINEAGGFRKDASVIDASLSRTTGEADYDPEYERLKTLLRADMTDDEYDYLKAKSRQRKGKVVVDFEQLFLNKNFKEDLILKRGDLISVPEAKNYVTLLGQVVNPGKIVFNEAYSVDDYIQLAGGFGWRAIEGDVRVIKSNTGEWIDDEDVESIDPGDTIWIPEDPPGPKFWDVFTTSLQILGQVAAVVAATVAVIVASR